jgi:hypothetical protein
MSSYEWRGYRWSSGGLIELIKILGLAVFTIAALIASSVSSALNAFAQQGGDESS